MHNARIILNAEKFDLTIERLAYKLIEDYDNFEDTCFVGIQTGGVMLAQRLIEKIAEIAAVSIPFGKLDITFYRDDFRTSKKPLAANINEMNFVVENQRVILIDDVLYTGRSVQAALTALNHYGRALDVKLLVMVDRRFNRQIPVRADYAGIAVDALNEAYVRVDWQNADVEGIDTEGGDKILFFEKA